MAQNRTGFGQKAFRAAGGGLAGAAEPAAPHRGPGAPPTFTRSGTRASARQTDPLGLTSLNRVFEISRRELC